MTSEGRKTCFIVGPIGSLGTEPRKSADFLLKGIIRPSIEESLNLAIWRADEDNNPGMITDKVIGDIYESDLVVADLSELNPNVFYELGIRHAASKPTIHMASQGTKLPFDNLGHRAIFFDRSDWDSVEGAKKHLHSQASIALADNFEVSNPITQALSARAFRASAKPTEKIMAELMGRVERLETGTPDREYTEINRNKIRLDEIHLREIRDIFEDVLKPTKIDSEEPYFSQAMERILQEYGRSSIVNLYDIGDAKKLKQIFTQSYIPF
jgi:hypothetical protein